MTQRTPLSQPQIEEALHLLPGWTHDAGALVKEWTFQDFREAIAFIVRVAIEAEKLNHHPDLRNVYNRVEMRLNTHDAGGKVTEMDVSLARAIEGFGA